MERSLEIQKFRNIGLDNKEKLVINNSMKKGEMGNLIILVGANNSGKSNVLDALISFGDHKIDRRDVTTLRYAKEERQPSLRLVTKDGKLDDPEEYSYSITYGIDDYKVHYPKNNNKKVLDTKENDKKLCDLLVSACNTYKVDGNEFFELSKIFEKDGLTTEEQIVAEEKVIDKLKGLKLNNNYFYQHIDREVKKQFAENVLYKKACISVAPYQELKQIYSSKYSVEFMPTIVKYKEIKISNSQLQVPYKNLSSNSFMRTLLKTIDFKEEDVLAAYSDYERLQDKGILRNISDKVNKKLNNISKEFNALYFLEEDTYRFEIDCESSQICFVMFRSSDSISLDYQSTGFKWFFNLYFNLLASNNLQPGDIIVMDEPATNLHTMGQTELRKFLKEFAIKNDLTIILATHSPFLVDIDYLDELRVVTMKNNISSIENDFAAINPKDPDSLKPIKTALTIGNHVLYDPYKKVIFVEGITDYNYMVAFKNILEYQDIIFLPIRGVGDISSDDFKKRQAEISKELIRIKKHNPILMVDGDRAGKSMQKLNKDDSELEVFSLTDIDPNFKNIEDLFAKEDLDKYGLKEKRSSLSSLFKTHYANKKYISEETINNFKKLFDYIMQQF